MLLVQRGREALRHKMFWLVMGGSVKLDVISMSDRMLLPVVIVLDRRI